MAHGGKDDGNFVDPSKVPMPAWRTALVVLYSISVMLWGFVSGRIKKMFGKK